jgi:nucleoside-diphosphate-sugar epimerase
MQRDFTYVDDVTEALVRLIDHVPQGNPDWSGAAPDPGSSAAPWRIYNVGNNRPEELMRVVAILEQELGCKAKRSCCRCNLGTSRLPMPTSMTSSAMSISGRRRPSKRALANLSHGIIVIATVDRL